MQLIRRPVPCPPVGKTGAMANYKTKNWHCPEASLHCHSASQLGAARTSNPSPLLYPESHGAISATTGYPAGLCSGLQWLCSSGLKGQTPNILPMLRAGCECGEGIEGKWNGLHKESTFQRHPLIHREHAPPHPLGGTPAIFKAQLVFSEVRCRRGRNLTFWGW